MDAAKKDYLLKKIREMGESILKEKKREDITFIVEEGWVFDRSGTYNIETKTIKICLHPLLSYAKKIKRENEKDILLLAKFSFMHELGHAQDTKLPITANKLNNVQIKFYKSLLDGTDSESLLKICEKITVSQEKIAWKYAYSNLSNNEKHQLFRRRKKSCLDSYFKSMEHMRHILKAGEVFQLLGKIDFPFSVPETLSFSFDSTFSPKVKYNLEKSALEFNLPDIASYMKDERNLERNKLFLFFMFLEQATEYHLEKEYKYKKKINTLNKHRDDCIDNKREAEALILTKIQINLSLKKSEQLSSLVVSILKDNEPMLVSSYKKYSKTAKEKEYNKLLREKEFYTNKLKS